MQTFTIREVCNMYDLTPSTLRYYEEAGLLTNVKRDGTKRLYEKKHINRVGAIICLKEAGMSIGQLQTFFIFENTPGKEAELVDILVKQESDMRQNIFSLLHNHKHILRKLKFYTDLKNAHENNTQIPDWKLYRDIEIPDMFLYLLNEESIIEKSKKKSLEKIKIH